MTQDRTYLGILLMLGFSMIAPIGDAIVKLLGPLIPVMLFSFYRFFLQAAFLAPIVLGSKQRLRATPRQLGLILLRSLFHFVGLGSVFMALRYLPLADAIAIAFVMPFIQLMLGKLFLNEVVGKHRIIACAVGFSGTLLVIQPSFAAVGMAALWPLGAAMAFALFMLVGRQIAQEMDPIAIQMISGGMASAVLLPILLIGGAMGWDGVAFAIPQGQAFWLMLAAGALGTVAHLLMTWSLRFAPSATLAPLTYIEIPITTLVGFIVFGDLPNGLAALGICITMAAGLYIIFRERATHRSLRAEPTPHSPAQP